MLRSSPIERMADPAMLLISDWRKELSAAFIVKPLVFPSARYMPDASMVMAIFPRSSSLMALSSSRTALSVGASMTKASPRLFSVCDSFTPQTKSTGRPLVSPSPTVALTFSVAVMWSVGLYTSPVNST